jgi:sec-independent protein translocase protein TatA
MISGISIGSLLIILLIVVLLFGTKKLRNIGQDMGAAIKNFRSAVKEKDEAAAANETNATTAQAPKIEGQIIDVQVKEKSDVSQQRQS